MISNISVKKNVLFSPNQNIYINIIYNLYMIIFMMLYISLYISNDYLNYIILLFKFFKHKI